GSNVPEGTVTFTVNGQPGQAVTLSEGRATFTTVPPPGEHNTITATYNGFTLGDYIFNGSNDGLTQEVNALTPELSLSVSTNPAAEGQAVVATYGVTFPAGGPGPDGTLTLYTNGGIAITGGWLQVKQDISGDLSVGTNSLLVTYSGDSHYANITERLTVVVHGK